MPRRFTLLNFALEFVAFVVLVGVIYLAVRLDLFGTVNALFVDWYLDTVPSFIEKTPRVPEPQYHGPR